MFEMFDSAPLMAIIGIVVAIIIIVIAVCVIKIKENITDDANYYDEDDCEDDDDWEEEDENDDDDWEDYDGEEEPSGVVIVLEWSAASNPNTDTSAPSAAILGGAKYIVANIDPSDVMGWTSTYAARLQSELTNKMGERGYIDPSVISYVMPLKEDDK